MKKTSRIAFFLAAVAFNLICTAALFFGLLFLWGAVLAPLLRLPSSSLVILCAFAASVVGSAYIYKRVLAYCLRRFSNEKSNPLTKP